MNSLRARLEEAAAREPEGRQAKGEARLDGADLKARLESDQQSPMTYDADLPQEVLDEDKLIDNIPIGFDSITIVPADEVFR